MWGKEQIKTVPQLHRNIQYKIIFLLQPLPPHPPLFLCPHLNMAKEQHRLEEEILKDPRRGFKNITLELTEHSRGENRTQQINKSCSWCDAGFLAVLFYGPQAKICVSPNTDSNYQKEFSILTVQFMFFKCIHLLLNIYSKKQFMCPFIYE